MCYNQCSDQFMPNLTQPFKCPPLHFHSNLMQNIPTPCAPSRSSCSESAQGATTVLPRQLFRSTALQAPTRTTPVLQNATYAPQATTARWEQRTLWLVLVATIALKAQSSRMSSRVRTERIPTRPDWRPPLNATCVRPEGATSLLK